MTTKFDAADPVRSTGGALADDPTVSFAAATRVWLRIGLLSFGGPAGQVALMHRELVERRQWIGEERFLHALNYCMLLPGPEAQQLAIYIGWLLHRTWGGIVAGTLFVLPGALVVLAFSILYAYFQHLPAVAALFFGLKAGVLAIVVEAVVRIGRRALKGRAHVAIAAASFIAIYAFHLPFPWIVLGAAVVGALLGRAPKSAADSAGSAASASDSSAIVDRLFTAGRLEHTRPDTRRALRSLVLWGLLWIAPFVLLAAALGSGSVWVQQGVFFSQAAVVTFGGAYAVLSYVAQRAVEGFGWLMPGEMLDGLALAETTPGPLILVLQFVGFLGAFRAATGFSPFVAGLLGAAVTLWATFIPCFLWIFVGAPFVEAVRNVRLLKAALAGVTAAVVGVILNLSIWFALHTLFGRLDSVVVGPLRFDVPDVRTVVPAALVLTIGSLLAILRFKWSMPLVLAICAGLGIAWGRISS